MANGEKFCLRWNDFENNISNSFRELRDDKDFFDVTLACDDNQLQAHKVILSACSPFFRSVLKKNPHQHPLLYLKGVKYEDILSVLNFMYHGEVNVAQEELNSFLAVAEDLQVKGLTQKNDKQSQPTQQPPVINKRPQEHYPPPPVPPTRPIKQPQPRNKTSYDHSMPSNQAFQPRREIQEFSPQIKTEVPVVLDCDEEPEDNHQMVETDEYSADQGGYEYDQSYQDQNMMYQVGEMDMGQVGDHTQDSHQVWDQYQSQFPCEYCEKSFINKRSYYNHLGIHKGKTTCSVCQKMFSTTSNLNLHMRNVHSM